MLLDQYREKMGPRHNQTSSKSKSTFGVFYARIFFLYSASFFNIKFLKKSFFENLNFRAFFEIF